MYVRVRLLLGSDTQTHHINCRSINETMDELRDKVARKWKCDNASVVRLFFDGKEVTITLSICLSVCLSICLSLIDSKHIKYSEEKVRQLFRQNSCYIN